MEHIHHHHSATFGLINQIETLDLVGLASIFSASFFMSLHCIGMCCPLVNSFLGKQAYIKSYGIWLYQLGRLVSYTGAGFILGFLSQSISGISPSFGRWLALVIGTGLIIYAILHPWRRQLLSKRGKFSFPSRWLSRLKTLPPTGIALCLGLITVLLPCMTLSPALALAAGSHSSWHGFVLMLAFYLGTVPAMLTATSVPVIVGRRLPAWINQYGVALFLLISGIITILRTLSNHQ